MPKRNFVLKQRLIQPIALPLPFDNLEQIDDDLLIEELLLKRLETLNNVRSDPIADDEEIYRTEITFISPHEW